MSGYIYNLVEASPGGQVTLLNSSTKKYVITDYVKNNWIQPGHSIAWLNIWRAVDGRPASVKLIDVYEFMEIDLGEE